MTLTPDYSNLPKPAILEELDYATIRDQLIADVTAAFQEIGVSYNVGLLESDPVVIQAEVYANREHRLRQRVNEAIRAYMVPFSAGTDLDMLGAFYGVSRLVGETDNGMRVRVIEAIVGRSTGGPVAWYRYHALSASPRVKDVSVYGTPKSSVVNVSVLATDNNGIPDHALLETVRSALADDSVRVVSDEINVLSAVFQTVNIQATVHLLDGAPYSVFSGLAAGLQQAWALRQAMGVDLTHSWIVAQLMQPGVQKVVVSLPAEDVVVGGSMAIAMGAIDLTFGGYST